MMNEKPVKVIRHNNRKHKTETRVFARNIHESFCAQKGCEFFGKIAAQGVCHTRFGKGFPHGYFDTLHKQASSNLEFYRKQFKKKGPREWVRFLEGQHVCDWMNNGFMLDELVRTRAEIARLRNKLGMY